MELHGGAGAQSLMALLATSHEELSVSLRVCEGWDARATQVVHMLTVLVAVSIHEVLAELECRVLVLLDCAWRQVYVWQSDMPKQRLGHSGAARLA